jgi:hypothetical protein
LILARRRAPRKSVFSHLPELELPAGFDEAAAWRWVERIPSANQRTMVAHRLEETLAKARRSGRRHERRGGLERMS